MNKETTPDGRKVAVGTLGEVYPICFEKQKDDAKRFVCLIKQGICEHEAVCFIGLQRTINKLFQDDSELVGGKFVWSTDKKRYVTKVPATSMIHSVFEIADDKYTPIV